MLGERSDIPNRLAGEKVYAAAGGALIKVSIPLISPVNQDFISADSVSMLIRTKPVGADGMVIENNGLPFEPPSRTVTLPLTGTAQTDPQPELDEALEAAVEEAAIWTARVINLRQALTPWIMQSGV